MSTALSPLVFMVAAGAYLAASTLYYLGIARPKPEGEPMALASGLLAAGTLTHAGYVVLASFVAHACPIYSVHFILSLSSLAASAAYLLARRRFNVHALGVVAAPFGLVSILGTFFLGAPTRNTDLPAAFVGVHVFANLLGNAMFLLAFGAAVMYLVQEGRLKNRKAALRGQSHLPPLDALDKAVHRFLLAGFPLLTIGVATGTVWAKQLDHGTTDELIRSIFGYATWLLIAGVLSLRVVLGWRGRRSAYGTLAGFACALTVLAIYFVRPALRAMGTIGG